MKGSAHLRINSFLTMSSSLSAEGVISLYEGKSLNNFKHERVDNFTCKALIKWYERFYILCELAYSTLFPHTLLCSRWLWKLIWKNLETPLKWKWNNWKELKTWRQKEKLLVWAISSFVAMFSKSCLLQRRQKASIWRKGLTSLYEWRVFEGILPITKWNHYK